MYVVSTEVLMILSKYFFPCEGAVRAILKVVAIEVDEQRSASRTFSMDLNVNFRFSGEAPAKSPIFKS
jgi:hypothetical protein